MPTTTTAPRTRPRAARVRDLVVGWAPVVVAVVLAVVLWPSSLGGCTTVVVVQGGSMEPTYAPGDLLVARCGPTAVGDVVVYEPPTVPGGRVVHRVVGGDVQAWVLQGDANDWLDPWTPPQDLVLGRVVAHVPTAGLGSLLVAPLLWASLVVVGVGVLVWPRVLDEPGRAGRPAARAGRDVPRRGLVPACAAGIAVVLPVVLVVGVAVGMPRARAHAAAVPLGTPSLLAWTAPADPGEPPAPLPAASCRTTDPDLPCTAEVRVGAGDWAAGYDVYVTVRDARTNGSTALVPWTVRLDLAQAPFPWVPDALGASGLVAGTTCADLPVLEVSGVTGWGDHHLLGPGAPVHEDVWLQAHRGDPAAPGTLLDCR